MTTQTIHIAAPGSYSPTFYTQCAFPQAYWIYLPSNNTKPTWEQFKAMVNASVPKGIDCFVTLDDESENDNATRIKHVGWLKYLRPKAKVGVYVSRHSWDSPTAAAEMTLKRLNDRKPVIDLCHHVLCAFYFSLPSGDNWVEYGKAMNAECLRKVLTFAGDKPVRIVLHKRYDGWGDPQHGQLADINGSRAIFQTIRDVSVNGKRVSGVELWCADQYFSKSTDPNPGDQLMKQIISSEIAQGKSIDSTDGAFFMLALNELYGWKVN